MSALPAHFWSKAARTDCIVWQGAQNSMGYGCFGIEGRSHLAHRLAWEDARGPIPDGMQVDHLCRNRACINVAHLELVTNQENTRRAVALTVGSTCKRGHAIASEGDLYERASGIRECRACRREAARRHKGKGRAETAQQCGPCRRGQHGCCDGNRYVPCECHGRTDAYTDGARLSEDERRRILTAYRDGVLEPGHAVLIEVERILAAQMERALVEHREEWASYVENWDASVGPEPPTASAIVAALRCPSPPFGVAAGGDSRW